MTVVADELEALERSTEKTRSWVDEVARELCTNDRPEAYTTLKAVLHAIRDGITVHQAAHLAAELPDRLRWAFYDGWVPDRVPRTYRDRDDFLRTVAREADLADTIEASCAVASVMAVLERHVSAAEIDEVLAALPGQVRLALELTVR
jgi:uncharacterized protein (DUF2267 family)